MRTQHAIAALAFAACTALYAPTTFGQAAPSANDLDNPRSSQGTPAGTADRTGDAAKDASNRATGTMNNAGNDANRTLGNTTGDGNTAMAPDAEDMKGMLSDATEAFVKKGTFDDLVERFVDADRNRIGKDRFAEQDHADLNAASDAFMAAWKAKYSKDFDIADEKVVFNDTRFRFTQGEIGDEARPAGGTMTPRTNNTNNMGGTTGGTGTMNGRTGNTGTGAGVTGDMNTTGGSVTVNPGTGAGNTNAADNANVGNTRVDSPDTKAADTNRNDPGRNIATVTVSPGMGQPALSVPLIHEMPDAWRIDVPDTVDGPKLKQNLVSHLNALTAMQGQWPADANEAYRIVSTHMLMAVLDKPANANQ